MKIDNICLFQVNNTQSVKRSDVRRVPFRGGIQADKTDFLLFKPLLETLGKLKNYTVEEYKNLSEQELQTLRIACNNILLPANPNIMYSSDESIHEMASEYVKNYLDKKYGKDGYVVITIGRSLSSIGKVLGYKIGEDRVKNIPLSEAKKYLDDSFIEKEKRNGGIAALKKFLNSIGLNKEKIEQSDKRYIIMDYCNSGKSLKGATKLLTRDDVLGNRKIDSLDIIKCIHDLSEVADSCEEYSLQMYLYYGKGKKLSFVKQASCLEDVPKAIVNTTEDSVMNRLLRFKMLDNVMQKQICNEGGGFLQ